MIKEEINPKLIIGNFIKDKRKKLKLTQHDISDLMEISVRQYIRKENGLDYFNPFEISKLSEIFDLDIFYASYCAYMNHKKPSYQEMLDKTIELAIENLNYKNKKDLLKYLKNLR